MGTLASRCFALGACLALASPLLAQAADDPTRDPNVRRIRDAFRIEGVALFDARPARGAGCADSTFAGLTWCATGTAYVTGADGTYSRSFGYNVDAAGRVVYVILARKEFPLARERFEETLRGYSVRYGRPPTTLDFRGKTREGDEFTSQIAYWGPIKLVRLGEAELRVAAQAGSLPRSHLVDHRQDVRLSAAQRDPVYRIEGSAGFIVELRSVTDVRTDIVLRAVYQPAFAEPPPAKPDAGKPEATKPDAASAEAAKPETAKRQAAKPEPPSAHKTLPLDPAFAYRLELLRVDEERKAAIERARREEEERKAAIERARREEEERKAAEARRIEAERKAAEERARREEEERKAAEARRLEDERKAAIERARREEEERKAAEERRLADERARREEAERRAAEERARREEAERKAAEARRIAEERARLEAAERKAAEERRALEERARRAEAEYRATVERARRAEAERKAAEDRARQAEIERKAAEDRARRIEEERKAAEQRRAEERVAEERRAAEERLKREEAERKAAAELKAAEERRAETERKAAESKSEEERKAAEERRTAEERLRRAEREAEERNRTPPETKVAGAAPGVAGPVPTREEWLRMAVAQSRQSSASWLFERTRDRISDDTILRARAIFSGGDRFALEVAFECNVEAGKRLKGYVRAFDERTNAAIPIPPEDGRSGVVRGSVALDDEGPQTAFLFPERDERQASIVEVPVTHEDIRRNAPRAQAWLRHYRVILKFRVARGEASAAIYPYADNLRRVLEACAS